MEEWQRVASEKEEDGLEKKSVDSRNDYGDSNEDSYQQQILEKTRLAFAAHAARQQTNNNDNNDHDTQQILKNCGDDCGDNNAPLPANFVVSKLVLLMPFIVRFFLLPPNVNRNRSSSSKLLISPVPIILYPSLFVLCLALYLSYKYILNLNLNYTLINLYLTVH